MAKRLSDRLGTVHARGRNGRFYWAHYKTNKENPLMQILEVFYCWMHNRDELILDNMCMYQGIKDKYEDMKWISKSC